MGQTQYTQGYRSGLKPAKRGFGTPPEAISLSQINI